MHEVLAGFLVVFVIAAGLTGQIIFLRRREESYLDVLEARIRTMADFPAFPEVYPPVPLSRKGAR